VDCSDTYFFLSLGTAFVPQQVYVFVAMTVRSKAKRRAGRIPRVVRGSTPELKFLDTDAVSLNVSYDITTSGQTENLSSVPQGVDYNQRVGNYIRGVRLDMKVSAVVADADLYNKVRVMILRWKTILAPTNAIFQFPTAGNTPVSPISQAAMMHTQVLYDKVVTLYYGGPGSHTFEVSLPTNMRFHFGGPAAATYDVGQLFFVIVSDSGVTPFPLCSYCLRFFYCDD